MRFGPANILRAITITSIIAIIILVPRRKSNYQDTTNLVAMPNLVCHDTVHVIAPHTMQVIPIWLACHFNLFQKYGLYVDLTIAKDKLTCDDMALKNQTAIIITDTPTGYPLPGYALSYPHFLCKNDFMNAKQHFSRTIFLRIYNESVRYMYSHYAEKWGYKAFKALAIPDSLYHKVSIPHFDCLTFKNIY